MISTRNIIVVSCVAFALLGCASPPPAANQEEDIVRYKVPILGDIPLLGILFRSETRTPRQHSPSVEGQTNSVAVQGVAMPSTQTNSVAARLKTLKDLRDNGYVTESEYESQRKILVDQL